MKVGFNKFFPVISSVLIVLMIVLIVLSSGRTIPINSNIYFLISMMLMFNMPMFFIKHIHIDESEIVIRNQFGMVRRRYAINNYKEIEVIGKTILINKNGTLEIVKFIYLLADKNDLRSLKHKIEKLKSYESH